MAVAAKKTCQNKNVNLTVEQQMPLYYIHLTFPPIHSQQVNRRSKQAIINGEKIKTKIKVNIEIV